MEYSRGFEAGRAWARSKASRDELHRLRSLHGDSDLDWAYLFSRGAAEPYSSAEGFCFGIRPKTEGIRQNALEFWVEEVGLATLPGNTFVFGFAEGAIKAG